MKTIRNKNVIILNIIVAIIFALPIFRLNLLKENYSTLSLNYYGYVYLLIIGILMACLLAYETYFTNRRNTYLIFASCLLAVIIPHHYPYNLQGELHLICAYVALLMMIYCCLVLINSSEGLKLNHWFIGICFIAMTFSLSCGMINTASEIIMMYAIMLLHLKTYLSKNKE